MQAAAPTVRRPYLSVICGATRDSVRLGRYDVARRPYAGPDMPAAHIEERRAELAFLRTAWPQGPIQSADVAPKSGTRTDDGTLGGVGPRGVTQASMADTDTAGTVECAVQAGASVAPESAARTDDGTLGEVGLRGVTRAPTVDTNMAGTVECAVHAGASDAEECGLDARDDFEVFERAVETVAVGSGCEAGAEVADGTTVRCGARPHGALDVGGETTARRTGSEMLGAGGSQGVVPTPVTDTGTAGAAECEVRADACGAEGRGMSASDEFFFGRAASSEMDAEDMAGGDSGTKAAGDDRSTGARAATARAHDAIGDAAVESGGGVGAQMVVEGASLTAVRDAEVKARGDGAFAAPTPAEEPEKRPRRCKASRAAQDKRKRRRNAENPAAAPGGPAEQGRTDGSGADSKA